MATRSSALVVLVPILLLLVLLPSTAAHNITRLLDQFPQFSFFNSLLNRTGIAAEINRRSTVTVLALDNDASASLAGLDLDSTMKHALAVHVILDYYDPEKFHALKRRTTLLTTLFQTTGVAGNRMGFLNMTKLSDGRIAFGSATPGAGLVATYVKSLAARPYNISVLHVSGVIIPPGIDGAPVAPFTSPVIEIPQPPEAATPGPSVEDTVDDTVADAPEQDAPTESPSLSPAADAPEADSSLASPTSTEEDAEDDVPWETPKKSSAGRGAAAGSTLVLAMGAALWLAL